AHLGLAKALTDSGQSDKALPELEEAVRLEPTDPTAHYRLALLYRKAGRTDDAKRELELYSQYKQMKEKLRALYKDLLIQPKEIQPDSQDEK
ncbi:MAG TPA: tetratricopeptide repeat protein, partial [Acidobacteriaceae bacterium]|nr:tetratricopeptide repeat protein [Acidobacteriaceae bacterium]